MAKDNSLKQDHERPYWWWEAPEKIFAEECRDHIFMLEKLIECRLEWSGKEQKVLQLSKRYESGEVLITWWTDSESEHWRGVDLRDI